MKKTNKILASALAVSLFCLFAVACSNEDKNNETTAENNIPISMELSESAQTAPEITSTEDTTTEITSAETEQTTAESIEETNAENPETSIIGENTTESVTEAATENIAQSLPESNVNADGAGEGIVELALSLDGKPFYYGGANPDIGFDNSGLMHYVLNQNGINCPRLTKDIAEWGEKVTYDELQPGYLVFFEYEGSGKADFGGIYIGDGSMIVSTDESRPVSQVNIATDYYKKTFQFGIKTF